MSLEAAKHKLRELLPSQSANSPRVLQNYEEAGLSPASPDFPHHPKRQGLPKIHLIRTPVLRTLRGSLVPVAYGVYVCTRPLGALLRQ